VKNLAVIQAFGRRLQALRETRRWSQQELGDYANVAKATIQRIEYGQSAPPLDVLVSLADALGLPLPERLTLGKSASA
jgi:transcriptional regulator with XRE-family HTH domain